MYRWYSDPGHAWLEVSVDDYLSLDVKASECSYLDSYFKPDNKVYLEEDCDAGLFIKAWEEKYNRDFDEAVVDSVYQENTFIRGLISLNDFMLRGLYKKD